MWKLRGNIMSQTLGETLQHIDCFNTFDRSGGVGDMVDQSLGLRWTAI